MAAAQATTPAARAPRSNDSDGRARPIGLEGVFGGTELFG